MWNLSQHWYIYLGLFLLLSFAEGRSGYFPTTWQYSVYLFLFFTSLWRIKWKWFFPAIQNFLKTAHPTECLLSNHHIGFWPIFSDLFRGVKDFAIRPLKIYSLLLSPPADIIFYALVILTLWFLIWRGSITLPMFNHISENCPTNGKASFNNLRRSTLHLSEHG